MVEFRRKHDENRPWHDKETLEHLYDTEGMSTTEIADHFDNQVSHTTIANWLEHHGIETRGPGGYKQVEDEGYKDAERLRHLYYDEGLSYNKIGSMYGVEAATISYWMGELRVQLIHDHLRALGHA